MPRTLTASTSLDNLKKEAKRWLKALQDNDASARERLEKTHPTAPARPVLREVQHALAREYGFDSWAKLKEAVAGRRATGDDELATRFLEFACPDHHVRSAPAHEVAAGAAMRLLERHPEIARADVYTAVVCGEIEAVERTLGEQPGMVNARRPASGPDRSGSGGSYDFLGDLGGKDWTPLLFLCHTRLPLERANENAVEMARLLLDRGADPNAYFMAGDSRYTPLSGAVGEGEEGRPPHPRRDELVRLLLERGAEPYDSQVVYNIHFKGRVLWYLKLMHEFSMKAGRAADWADPEWTMLTQGPYGSGARWHLRIAVEHNDVELAEWCLAHGATANPGPERGESFDRRSIYEQAVRRGHTELAELLARYGAPRVAVELSPEDEFVAAALRLDREAVARDAEMLRSHRALFEAARLDRADVAAMLLDLGTPVDVRDEQEQTALHVAAYQNSLGVARLLIERGAEVDARDRQYEGTPFDFAVHGGNREMWDVLAPHSKDVWNLVRTGRVARVRELLLKEPGLAAPQWGTTPLFWLPDDPRAAVETARVLLEAGVDAGFRNEDGKTAAELARRRGLDETAELLEGWKRWQGVAEDYVRAYDGDAAALDRLNAHYERAFTREDLAAEIWRRNYAYRQRSSKVEKNYLPVEEARTIVAQDAGFSNWNALVAGKAAVPAFGIAGDRIGPRRRLTDRDWEELAGAAREHRVTAVEANGLMTDRALGRIAELEHVTSLDLSGSRELTDDGLLLLARMPQLERLVLNEYPGGKLTDRGLEVLRHLPNLREFEMTWQAGITDAGVGNLRFCERLERVDLMGSPTGNGAVEAVAGKAKLRAFSTGRLVTDAGLAAMRPYRGEKLLIDGPFTDAGVAHLAALENVAELDLFWHCTGITAAAFGEVAKLPKLESLACDGKLSDDVAMGHMGRMPRLRFLRAQESAATDQGFVALARSRTLEGYWGRRSEGFGTGAFLAFAKIPSLRKLGVNLAGVEDEALAHFAEMGLVELTPIGLRDDAFRHIGRCAGLERLTCMYCRETGDAATEHIAGLRLRYYYAGLTQITDRSLEILGGMGSLEEVEIYECKGVSDAGLKYLAALPRLRKVAVNGSPGVTYEGTKVFGAGVKVEYST